MKKMLAVSAVMVASLLLAGCSGDQSPLPSGSEPPLVSTAQGLGEEKKVPEHLFMDSQFGQIYDSTNGAVSFEELDTMDWKVERVLSAPEGEKLPAGDNFKATTTNNFSYMEVVKNWAEDLKKDGWEAKNEIKPEPREDEYKYEGSEQDYRWQPYSIDLSKGKSSVLIRIDKDNITVTINSQ